jgi:HEAT repeat protein
MFEQYVVDLTHTDPAVRYEAAQKLGASKDSRAIQPLIAALPDSNSKVQYAALSGLIKLNAEEAVEPILDMLLCDLNSRVWQLLKLNIGLRLRNGLLEMIPHGDEHMTEHLVNALETPNLDDHQRALLLRLLGRTATNDRVDMLIDILLHGTPTVQGAAAEALGYLGDPSGVSPLMLFLHVNSNELREIAVEALGRIGHDKAFDAVLAMLDDESEWVRRAAAVALGDIGDRRAIERLSAALNDENELVQDAAFEALKKLSYGKYDMTM